MTPCPDDETTAPQQPDPRPQPDPQWQRELPPPADAARSDAAPFKPGAHQSQHTPKDAKGRFLRKDGSFIPASSPPRQKRKRQPRRVKHFGVDLVLTDPAERAEYDRLLADPNQTTDMLTEWLRAHGHSVCKNSVQRHRRHTQLHLQQLRECSQMASMFCALSRRHGAGAIAEANQGKLEMELMMGLFKLREGKKSKRPPAYWSQMSKTLAGMVATRRSVEEMRADFEAKAKAAVQEVQKLSSRDAGHDIVARMEEILGV